MARIGNKVEVTIYMEDEETCSISLLRFFSPGCCDDIEDTIEPLFGKRG